MINRVSLTRAVIIAVVTLVLLSTTAVATLTIDTSSDYVGHEEGEPQAVEVEYTVSPEDNSITNMRIQVDNTANSFIDHESYERGINPGDADIDIESVGEGAFEIDEVQTNQEITLTFDAYPRDIQVRELDVAVIEAEYVQQGQSLSEETTITADLSDSPWFNQGGGPGFVVVLIFLVVGIAAGGGGVWMIKEEKL
jgi:hypothetical protein